MPRSRHPRNSRSSTHTNAYSRSPVTLGLQVVNDLMRLFGGGGRSTIAGMPATGTQASDPTLLLITELTKVLAALITAETACTTAITANTAAMQAGGAEGGLASLLGAGGNGEGSGFGVASLLGAGGDGEGSGGGIGGFFGSLFSDFGNILGIVSLGTSLFRMFSGSSQPQQVLTPYIAPAQQSWEFANEPGFPLAGLSVDGAPQVYNDTARSAPSPPATPAPQPLQVTVNVSTMDSRSFLDNAPMLASAVRDAMLNMHPINQLVRESL